ncbi:MAG: competence/damage-inducible protein A [Gammaproteobacteria bacterium]|nr:competence/damage-inducible protein A [Gammaproteobacteria bacterium]
MSATRKQVALLATGNEIVSGEIHNSNGQNIAQMLSAEAISAGLHLSCCDDIALLEKALAFLWQHHEAVITIGGLGPTSDDLTREAIAKTLQLPLRFDEENWQHIVARFKKVDVPLTDNNRQQAYFPEGANIIVNPNGSASACEIFHKQRWLFMLPGPPRECLPIFQQHVLPRLLQEDFSRPRQRKRWVVKGISESYLAEKIDAPLAHQDASIAYCCHSPYIDLTFETENEALFAEIVPAIEEIIRDYQVTDTKS